MRVAEEDSRRIRRCWSCCCWNVGALLRLALALRVGVDNIPSSSIATIPGVAVDADDAVDADADEQEDWFGMMRRGFDYYCYCFLNRSYSFDDSDGNYYDDDDRGRSSN